MEIQYNKNQQGNLEDKLQTKKDKYSSEDLVIFVGFSFCRTGLMVFFHGFLFCRL
jgi:hypothetical protein